MSYILYKMYMACGYMIGMYICIYFIRLTVFVYNRFACILHIYLSHIV